MKELHLASLGKSRNKNCFTFDKRVSDLILFFSFQGKKKENKRAEIFKNGIIQVITRKFSCIKNES